MATIAPWINVSPGDFLKAAQSGANIGQQIAEMATRAAIQREQIAASERENALRVSAQQSSSSASRAQAAREAEASRALREWELAQRLQMEQGRFGLQEDLLGQRQELAMQRLGLDQDRLDFDKLREMNDQEKIAQDRLSPVYRTVENQLVRVDPETGEAESLFTAPYRPSSGGALAELFRAAGAGTELPSAPAATSSGGYQVGRVYGGLKYLGGDPNNESNWEKVR